MKERIKSSSWLEDALQDGLYIQRNFGNLPMPPGYAVIREELGYHWFWTNEYDEDGFIALNAYWCRRCAWEHYWAHLSAEKDNK